ncbi:hypothetical protein AB4Y96_09425 [Phyllobacterium sp. TAF24]|uniref:hypothetical protein n=1 Tax=Phyllobacterium sp. TAF24 TaxID=3233068 RepID=UPI003F9BECE2
MKVIALLAIAALLVASPSVAARIVDPEQSAKCDKMAAKIVDALGATVTERRLGYYALKIESFEKLGFVCDRTSELRQFDGIEISYDEGNAPPNAWWSILGIAGEAFSGLKKRDVVELAKSCLADAKNEQSYGNVSRPKIAIECQLSTKTGEPLFVRIFPKAEQD